MRTKLGKLEQRAGALAETVTLRDGSKHTIGPGRRFEAFCAMLEGRSHPLLDLVPRIDLEASPQLREFVALVEALQAHAPEKAEGSDGS